MLSGSLVFSSNVIWDKILGRKFQEDPLSHRSIPSPIKLKHYQNHSITAMPSPTSLANYHTTSQQHSQTNTTQDHSQTSNTTHKPPISLTNQECNSQTSIPLAMPPTTLHSGTNITEKPPIHDIKYLYSTVSHHQYHYSKQTINITYKLPRPLSNYFLRNASALMQFSNA